MARRWTFLFLTVGWIGFYPWHAWSSLAPQNPDQAAPSTRIAGKLEYTIGGGDLLRILVWKEPDFSGDYRVRFDGKITIPVVGDVSVSALTPEQVSRLLEGQLSRYIETPRVTVSIAEANSARFYVIGKVAQQGAFPYNAPIRVVQALAIAGGFQEFAKLDRIFVIRESNGKLIYFPVDYQDLVNRRKLEVNIPLMPGDTIVVP